MCAIGGSLWLCCPREIFNCRLRARWLRFAVSVSSFGLHMMRKEDLSSWYVFITNLYLFSLPCNRNWYDFFNPFMALIYFSTCYLRFGDWIIYLSFYCRQWRIWLACLTYEEVHVFLHWGSDRKSYLLGTLANYRSSRSCQAFCNIQNFATQIISEYLRFNNSFRVRAQFPATARDHRPVHPGQLSSALVKLDYIYAPNYSNVTWVTLYNCIRNECMTTRYLK